VVAAKVAQAFQHPGGSPGWLGLLPVLLQLLLQRSNCGLGRGQLGNFRRDGGRCLG